jgi:hypothetical protein
LIGLATSTVTIFNTRDHHREKATPDSSSPHGDDVYFFARYVHSTTGSVIQEFQLFHSNCCRWCYFHFLLPIAKAFLESSSSMTPKTDDYGASHTSFYTSTEKKESYESLDDVLNTKCKDPKVRHVIRDMFAVCADITIALRTALVTVEGSTNDFGDTQLSVDVSSASLFTSK